jgi:2-methylcitrate dehydratase PrpD
LGAYGATAAACSLLGSSAQQTHDAFALTLSQVTCTNQFRDSPESALRAIRDGFATHAGVLSAILAADGLVGFDEPFEGRAGLYALYANGHFNRDVLLEQVGIAYRGTEVSFKAWPACRGTHAYIEAALEIAADPGFDPNSIVSIKASGSSFLAFLFEPNGTKAVPATPIAAKFSGPFAIASSLCRGSPTLSHFVSEALADAEVSSLARRVAFVANGNGFRTANAGLLEINFTNGRTVRRNVAAARGHPANPLEDAELIAKFRSCAAAAAVVPVAANIDAFIDAVMTLGTRTNGTSAQQHPLEILYPRA